MKYSPATLLPSCDKETHTKGQRQRFLRATRAICKPWPSRGLRQLLVWSGEGVSGCQAGGRSGGSPEGWGGSHFVSFPRASNRTLAASATHRGGFFGLSHLFLKGSARSGYWGSAFGTSETVLSTGRQETAGRKQSASLLPVMAYCLCQDE